MKVAWRRLPGWAPWFLQSEAWEIRRATRPHGSAVGAFPKRLAAFGGAWSAAPTEPRDRPALRRSRCAALQGAPLRFGPYPRSGRGGAVWTRLHPPESKFCRLLLRLSSASYYARDQCGLGYGLVILAAVELCFPPCQSMTSWRRNAFWKPMGTAPQYSCQIPRNETKLQGHQRKGDTRC